MGPRRIDPFGEGAQVGVCGANAMPPARNLARKIAVGASAHSDHIGCSTHPVFIIRRPRA